MTKKYQKNQNNTPNFEIHLKLGKTLGIHALSALQRVFLVIELNRDDDEDLEKYQDAHDKDRRNSMLWRFRGRLCAYINDNDLADFLEDKVESARIGKLTLRRLRQANGGYNNFVEISIKPVNDLKPITRTIDIPTLEHALFRTNVARTKARSANVLFLHKDTDHASRLADVIDDIVRSDPDRHMARLETLGQLTQILFSEDEDRANLLAGMVDDLTKSDPQHLKVMREMGGYFSTPTEEDPLPEEEDEPVAKAEGAEVKEPKKSKRKNPKGKKARKAKAAAKAAAEAASPKPPAASKASGNAPQNGDVRVIHEEPMTGASFRDLPGLVDLHQSLVENAAADTPTEPAETERAYLSNAEKRRVEAGLAAKAERHAAKAEAAPVAVADEPSDGVPNAPADTADTDPDGIKVPETSVATDA